MSRGAGEVQRAFRDRYGPAALVTGASSGIGQAFAEALAARGFDLVLVARRRDRLERLAADLAATHGVRVRPLPVDLAQRDAAQAIVDGCGDSDVGLVVSNAGFGKRGDHAGHDAALLTEMLMVNCHAPLQLTRSFIPRLKVRGRGGILLTASVEGLIGCPWSAAYSASKAMVKTLGEALWAELRGEGIDVLALCPGATETEALARAGVDPATLRNAMKPRDVAELALEHIGAGPILIPSPYYAATFDHLLSLPREQALLAMASAMAERMRPAPGIQGA